MGDFVLGSIWIAKRRLQMTEPTKNTPRVRDEALRLWKMATNKPGYVSMLWWCLEAIARQLDGAKIMREDRDVGDDVRQRFLELMGLLSQAPTTAATTQPPDAGQRSSPNTTGPWPRAR